MQRQSPAPFSLGRARPDSPLAYLSNDAGWWADYIAGLRLPVLHTDSTGRILALSADACALFGRSRTALVGARLDELSIVEGTGTFGTRVERGVETTPEEKVRLLIHTSDGVTVATDWALLQLEQCSEGRPTYFWLG